MAAMNLQDKQFNTLLQRIRTDYPDIVFKSADITFWNPKNKIISYNPNAEEPIWSLLHEIGHMECGHAVYNFDIQLLLMEKDAWSAAKKTSAKYGIQISSDYIEDCLDSYRDWLHKRSLCPKCTQTGAQTDELVYYCVNCRHQWKVSISRFCRSYRRSI